jgi:hypothetical protein
LAILNLTGNGGGRFVSLCSRLLAPMECEVWRLYRTIEGRSKGAIAAGSITITGQILLYRVPPILMQQCFQVVQL